MASSTGHDVGTASTGVFDIGRELALVTSAPPEWVVLPTSPVAAPTPAIARLVEDVDALRGLRSEELDVSLGTYLTGAWAWCPDGLEAPRGVMLALAVQLPPIPGLGKLVDLGLDDVTDPLGENGGSGWGGATSGRAGSSWWVADLAYAEERRSGEAGTESPSAVVISFWKDGWPVNIGGTFTVLAPGFSPEGHLAAIAGVAEQTRTTRRSTESAGTELIRLVRVVLDAGNGDPAPPKVDVTMGSGTTDWVELPVDPVHPRAAGIFRLPPVVTDVWWPPPPERPEPEADPHELPPPPPTEPIGSTPSAVTEWPAGRRPAPVPDGAKVFRSRTVLRSAAVGTVIAVVTGVLARTAITQGRLSADAAPVVTLWAVGLFLGPLLLLVALGVRVSSRRCGGRAVSTAVLWLTGAGTFFTDIFLILWYVAEQAGEQVF